MQIQFITIKVLIQCHLGIKLIQCRALFHSRDERDIELISFLDDVIFCDFTF